MTQSKNSSLIQLSEVFPTWAQDDLLNVLNEAGGDVYVAIARISDGHVSQWAEGSKKVVVPPTQSFQESRPAVRPNRRDPKASSNKDKKLVQQRGYTLKGRKESEKVSTKPVELKPSTKSFVKDSKTSGPAIVTPSSAPKASKTSFAEAAAQALVQKAKSKKSERETSKETKKVEKSVTEETNELSWGDSVEPSPVAVTESVVLEAVEEDVVGVPDADADDAAAVIVVDGDGHIDDAVFEEEETVLMPARATPSLVMEQPAVVFPVRTNLRSNISVRFGYDSNGDEIISSSSAEKQPSSSSPNVGIEEDPHQSFKTPITMSALESTFAMMSAAPVAASRSPEPILSTQVTSIEPSTAAWESEIVRGSGRPHHSSWDYEQSSSSSQRLNTHITHNTTPSQSHNRSSAVSNGSPAAFGPAPGFSNPRNASPQRFASRTSVASSNSSHYDNNNNSHNNNNTNNRFAYDQDSSVGTSTSTSNISNSGNAGTNGTNGNNVSQYYTSRASSSNTSYPVYRGGNSFNPSPRYTSSSASASSNNRSYYQPQQGPQNIPPASTSVGGISQYAGYIPHQHQHQSYLNSYHQGYPAAPYHHPQQSEQYSSLQQQPQPQQQPYYQPYQPPNQYLSTSHHHPYNQQQHHHHHHQQHPNQSYHHQAAPRHSQH